MLRGAGGVLAEERYYKFYLDVALMMFVGFGYLMTFLRHYGLGAVGFTMLITCLGAQWALLVEGLWAEILHDGDMQKLSFSFAELIDSNFAVAAVLISFGALIGKVGPMQVLVLTLLEVVCYTANKRFLCMEAFGIADIGGTVVIHCFGAYFGLGAAYIMGTPKDNKAEENSTISDIFSLIGTVFLWLYWPSFVSALPEDGAQERNALMNTITALFGSTVITFGFSALLEKKIRPVDIQNATLAGGVAIGASANFSVTPCGALGIGVFAGALSTFGFSKVQPALAKLGLHDSCGVHNLHGMPSVAGGIISAIYLAIDDPPSMGAVPKWPHQSGYQFLAVGVTIAVATVSGMLVGLILKHVTPSPSTPFLDAIAWEVSWRIILLLTDCD